MIIFKETEMRLVSALVAVFLVIFLSHPAASQQTGAAGSHTYINEDIGVKASFDDNWMLITSREEAPELLKPNFPAKKGRNDSPLLLGIYNNQQLLVHLLAEEFPADVETYIKLQAPLLETRGVRMLSAKITPAGDAAELEYLAEPLNIRFRERFSRVQDKYILRMAFWSPDAMFSERSDRINDIYNKVEILNVDDGQRLWQKTWSGLEHRLPANDIEGIKIAEVAEMPELVCRDPASTMLWKIRGDNSEVYLLGSIHVGKADFYPLADVIEETFHSSDYIVFEVDPHSLTSPDVVARIQNRGMLQDGRTLNDVLSKQVMNDLVETLSRLGLPVNSFMNLQPWFLTMVLSSMQMISLGYLPDHGIEMYLIKNKAEQSRILELESIEQQIGFLEHLNGEAFLAYTLMGFEDGKEKINQMIDAWRCGDKEELNNILFGDLESEAETDPEMQALMEKLFFERNIDMSSGIRDFLENGKGDYFVVVGSGHLIGEKSVIDILDDQYEVKSVRLH